MKRTKSILKEIKRRKVDHKFDNGITLVSYGMNPNGNHTITIIDDTGKKKSIQTNTPGLDLVHRSLRGKFKDIDKDDLVKMGKEIQNFINL